MDWGLWYDTEETDPNRKKKFIRDVQYLAAMNNKAGSFTVNNRLLTHFALFSMNDPERDDLFTIFKYVTHIYLSLLFLYSDKLVKKIIVSKYVVKPHVLFVPKHAVLQCTLKR